MNDCVFCKIINKQIPAEILFEDEKTVVFKDIKPKAPIHLLIVPKKHIDSINDLEASDSNLIGELVYRGKKMAEEFKIAERGYKLIFNCGPEGGQVVYHIHLHLLGGRKLGE